MGRVGERNLGVGARGLGWTTRAPRAGARRCGCLAAAACVLRVLRDLDWVELVGTEPRGRGDQQDDTRDADQQLNEAAAAGPRVVRVRCYPEPPRPASASSALRVTGGGEARPGRRAGDERW